MVSLILKRHAQKISMTFQNTKMTTEHLISKYSINHCALLSTVQENQLSVFNVTCVAFVPVRSERNRRATESFGPREKWRESKMVEGRGSTPFWLSPHFSRVPNAKN